MVGIAPAGDVSIRTTEDVDLLSECIAVEPAPFQLPDLTAMSLLHYLFAICMYSLVYVTRQGRLVGIVYKGDFLDEKWLSRREGPNQ